MKILLLSICLLLSACTTNKGGVLSIEIVPENPALLKAIMETSSEDENLDPEVIDFINHQPSHQWSENAYVYLWGMAYKTADVYQTGLELAHKFAELNQAYDYKNEYDESFLQSYELMQIPGSEDFCVLREKDCFNQTIENLSDKLVLANKFRAMRGRYNEFMSLPHYSDVSGWVNDLESPIAPYRSITAGMKIQHVFWLEKLITQDKESVIQSIHEEAINLGLRLAQADSLISKMIFVHMYSEHLELINAAFAMGWLKQNEIRNISSLEPLNQAELSTELAWRNEEQVKMLMIKKTYHADTFDDEFIELFYSDLPEKMIKPNAVLNQLYFEFVMPLIEYRKQDPELFFKGLEDFSIKIEFDEIKNSGGTLLNISPEEVKNKYLLYQARLFSLNMKIQLLNAMLEQGTPEKVIEAANKGHAAYLNLYDQSEPFIEDGKLCYSGIFETNQRFRCLNIINPKPKPTEPVEVL